jgi:hypothetical protein
VFGQDDAHRLAASCVAVNLYQRRLRLLDVIVYDDGVVPRLHRSQQEVVVVGAVLEFDFEVLEAARDHARRIVIAAEKQTAEHANPMLGAW